MKIKLGSEFSYLAPMFRDDMIRLGQRNDGGYVIPKLVVENSDALLSFGVSTDWSFEKDFLRMSGEIPAHFYDHTISRFQFFRQGIRYFARAIFKNYGKQSAINNFSALFGYKRFFVGKKKHFKKKIVGTVNDKHETSLSEAINRLNQSSVFLKVDIEGFEYEILPNLIELSQVIIGLVVEFHQTDTRRKEFEQIVRELQTRYAIVHLHANNADVVSLDQLPKLLEISFVRNDMFETNATYIPRQDCHISGLDFPNLRNVEDYEICFNF